MRLFLEITKRSFQRQLTYRSAAVAGLVTNTFFGLLRAAVIIALYGSQNEVTGITIEAAITYTALTQGVIAYLSIFGWYDLMESVNTGEVGSDLLKPMDYFTFWLARDAGRAAVNFLTRGVTMIFIYALLFDIVYPSGLWQWAALAAALLLAWLLSFAWRFLVNLAAFWSPNARGVGRFSFGVVWVLSGFLMPLRFYPDWFITLANLTPFPSMVNTIVEIYLGILPGPKMAQALLIQALWTVGLIVLGQWALRAGLRRLVIQGG
jgi:ABC-2 type transport system permease protein